MSDLGPMRRGVLPFRVGATSFIFRDDVLPNVRLLARWVDDVEIVVYEYSAHSPMPDVQTLEELVALAELHDLTFTIHLPLDLRLAARDGCARCRSVARAAEVVQHMARVRPWAYVLHAEEDETPECWAEWRRLAQDSLGRLADVVGSPELLCLENLENQPPDEPAYVADRVGTSTCLDVGHLFKAGCDVQPYLTGPLNRARVLHLHGWDGEGDHRSLAVLPLRDQAVLDGALRAGPYGGVATLEVFSPGDLVSSWLALHSRPAENAGGTEGIPPSAPGGTGERAEGRWTT